MIFWWFIISKIACCWNVHSLTENVNGSHTVMYNWQWMCSIISCKMYPNFRDFKLRVGGSTRDACGKIDEKAEIGRWIGGMWLKK